MSKYYFYNKGDEFCEPLDLIRERIEDDELTQKTVFTAKRVTGEGHFFCKKYQEVGEVGEGCGKTCKDYKPRNGKNGRCVHSGYCYVPDQEVLIVIGQ